MHLLHCSYLRIINTSTDIIILNGGWLNHCKFLSITGDWKVSHDVKCAL